jgi:hypothetical protein
MNKDKNEEIKGFLDWVEIVESSFAKPEKEEKKVERMIKGGVKPWKLVLKSNRK